MGDVEKMILGNKCDMEDQRMVSTEDGQKLADEYGVPFLETSAKSSTNVEKAFFQMARSIKAKMDAKQVVQTPSAASKTPKSVDPGQITKKEGGGCCWLSGLTLATASLVHFLAARPVCQNICGARAPAVLQAC